MINVSIVIVCMNNLKNLYPCLDSIYKYTTVPYETFVVAYLFSKENLERLQKDYPWITIIESNEIRGFSENNNLALRQAKGEYCFVVNDDTYFQEPIIDCLYKDIIALPDEVAIISPKIVGITGHIQYSGREKMTAMNFLFSLSTSKIACCKNSSYIRNSGVFQTYNILGAGFLIKTKVFQSVGFFDENYFFCPEDIALSDTLNKLGYKCYVNADIVLIHKGGLSAGAISKVNVATRPAALMGELIFYSHKNLFLSIILRLIKFFLLWLQMFYHFFKSIYSKRREANLLYAIGDLNCISVIFSNKSPKEIFVKYFNRVVR